jgi:hypothetical protein
MSLFGAVTNAVKSAVQTGVQTAQQTAATVRAQVQEAPRPSRPTPAAVKDGFEQLPRPKVDLCARADQATGLHVKLSVAGLDVAKLGVAARGVSVTEGGTTVGCTREGGAGVSTHVFGYKVGVHYVQNGNEAMLGGVNVKHGGRESTIGTTPMAPCPLPLPNYLGADRNDEEV